MVVCKSYLKTPLAIVFYPFTQQMLQQAQRMSLLAQGLCGLVIFFYLLGFAPRVQENLAVTPA